MRFEQSNNFLVRVYGVAKYLQSGRIPQDAIIMIIMTLFTIVIKVQFSSSLHVQKCCYKNQQLSLDLKSCVDLNENENVNKSSPFEFEWQLPNSTQFLSSKDLTPMLYSSFKIELEILQNGDRKLFEHYKQVLPLDNKISLLDNGSLFLNGKSMYPYGFYCVDNISSTDYSSEEQTVESPNTSHYLSWAIILESCCKLPCIRRCCPESMYLQEDACHYSSNVPKNWIEQVFGLDTGANYEVIDQMPQCDESLLTLRPSSLSSTSKFSVNAKGEVNVEGSLNSLSAQNYCVYQKMISDRYQTHLLFCPLKEHMFQDILYTMYFIVGSVFLAATLLVYGLVPELRRTFYARIMISHVACMFVCYFTMAMEKVIKPRKYSRSCAITAYVLQFSFIAAIFWLNVMCFCTYKISTTLQQTHRFLTKNKVYFLYSLYVWGMTSTISLITYLADTTNFSEELKPHIGLEICWFTGGRAKFLFFYLPVSLVLLVNLVLFLFTVKGILGVQKESSRKIFGRDSNKHKGNKPVGSVPKHFYKLKLSAKLCAVMGITWIFEIISWAIGGPDYYWYLPDAINSLRGVFIFVICCCKKKVFRLLMDHLCRRGSRNRIEMNDYRLTNNPALSRRLTISSDTESGFYNHQLTITSTQGLRKPSSYPKLTAEPNP